MVHQIHHWFRGTWTLTLSILPLLEMYEIFWILASGLMNFKIFGYFFIDSIKFLSISLLSSVVFVACFGADFWTGSDFFSGAAGTCYFSFATAGSFLGSYFLISSFTSGFGFSAYWIFYWYFCEFEAFLLSFLAGFSAYFIGAFFYYFRGTLLSWGTDSFTLSLLTFFSVFYAYFCLFPDSSFEISFDFYWNFFFFSS